MFEESKVLHKHTFALKFLEISSCVYSCGMKTSQSDRSIPSFSFKSVRDKHIKCMEIMMKWTSVLSWSSSQLSSLKSQIHLKTNVLCYLAAVVE